ncbi:hypothetical protein CI109_106173 [Kwoniella shandongensis]|uniref:Uncharacterized protein n=1 Tax=Kwoniella shandongensis TaxID=1734106 RepID=A0A5M6BZX6_9TREE|nr:uncharacterized protein CI109_003781 [Kwoniella shandongensis]KAA5527810.1 hypothetical protein CI109_003781 [Kwoniella shandongensis]
MSNTIKTEGFRIPGIDQAPSRPHIHRPFSDGSMTVETNLLTSLMNASPHHQPMNNMVSPFSFSQSLPAAQHQPFEYNMTSPLSTSNDHFHPAAIFNALKFGNEHPEPPINLPPAPATGDSQQRSRSQSSSRSSHVGKAPTSRSRPGRKSMNDARPPPGAIQRGRSANGNGRTQSFQGHARTASQSQNKPMGLGIGLDTHVEGEPTDSISPPDFGMAGSFAMAIPRSDSMGAPDGASWGSGSVPSIMPGSLGSFDTADDAIIDSPMTPARPLAVFSEESFKKQRRRECHNQVEKRRREHINAKIEELNFLLPASYNKMANEEGLDEEDEEEANVRNSPAKKKKTKRAGSAAKSQKDAAHCKGRILTQSVQYIRDLKHMTEMQAGRIAQLEAIMLAYGMNPAIQAPQTVSTQQSQVWWNGNNANGLSNDQHNSQDFAALHGHHLEMMRPSPEPERQFSFDNFGLDNHRSSWAPNAEAQNSTNDILMGFEPSPTDVSSSSINMRRSSADSVSSGGSQDEEGNGADAPSPVMDDTRGRQRERTVRKDSQAELQMSMSSLFSGSHREEDAAGIRW